jgi:predicted nucleic acid-binding protein
VRRRDAAVAADFDARLVSGGLATCAMVRLELLWSARDAAHVARLRSRLDALREAPMGERVWRRATDVLELLAERGPLHHRQVALPDLLIAAAAELAELPILHYDRDFEAIAAVTGQPVEAIARLGSL